MNGRLAMAFGALTSILVGCTETETFELSFPSVEAFTLSESVRIYAVPTTPEEVGVCRDLLAQVEVGTPLSDAAIDTGRITTCEFRNGGVKLPSVGEGLRAFVAVAEDNVGDALFTGCTLRDVYSDSSEVTIVLVPTDVYRQKLADEELMLTGCSVEDRCSGACP